MNYKILVGLVLILIVVSGVGVVVYLQPGQPVAVDYGYLVINNGIVVDSIVGSGENYVNENLIITFGPVFYLRDIGNPENGLTIEFSKLENGWGVFTADLKNKENYGGGYIEENGYWSVSTFENAYIRWSLNFAVDSSGRFEPPSLGYLRIWADTDTSETNGYGTLHKPSASLWADGDVLKIRAWNEGREVLSENVVLIGSEN